jgi:hypothetical protein
MVKETSHHGEFIRELRSMNRKAAGEVLNRALRGKNSLDKALDYLYSLPTYTIAEVTVHHEVDKTSGKSRGKLKLSLEFQREEPARNGKNTRKGDTSSFTLLLVLGSLTQRMVLSETSLSVSSHGKGTWTVSKELDFDWDGANADGGEGKGQMILRLIWEEIRGFDSEMIVHIK